MISHTMNFTNSEEMSHCFCYLDEFVKVTSADEDEFDGDDLYEVRFTTEKPIPQTTIKKMLKYFDPKTHKLNQQ